MSIIEIAIVAVLFAAVFLALRRIFRMRKRGCSCGCAECGGCCEMSRRKEEPSQANPKYIASPSVYTDSCGIHQRAGGS